jgi:hypothetical protein
LPLLALFNIQGSQLDKLSKPNTLTCLRPMQNYQTQQGLVPVQPQGDPNLVYVGNDAQGRPIWVSRQQAQPQGYAPTPYHHQGAGFNQQVHFVQSPGFIEISSVSVSSQPSYMVSQQSGYQPAQPVMDEPEPTQPVVLPPGPDLKDLKFSFQQVGGFLIAVAIALAFLGMVMQLGQRDAQIEGIRQGAELVQ